MRDVRCEEILPSATWHSLRGAIGAAYFCELPNASSGAICLQAGSGDGLDELLGHLQAVGRLALERNSPIS